MYNTGTWYKLTNIRRMQFLLGMMLTLASIVLFLAVPAVATEVTRWAEPGDIGIRLTPLIGVITAGEPLLARVEIVNQTDKQLHLSMGNSLGSTTYFEVRNSKGEMVAATPKPQEGGMAGLLELNAGQVRTFTWIISALYEFREPGNYTLHVQQLVPRQDQPVVLAEDRAPVTVLPFDAAKLKARCDQLLDLRSIEEKTPYSDLAVGTRTRAIYSVRDDIVLTHLERIAREWAGPYAVRAMRRLGTEKALKLVNQLAAEEGKTVEVARAALTMRLEPRNIVWDMGR